jgi:hypothetical protein
LTSQLFSTSIKPLLLLLTVSNCFALESGNQIVVWDSRCPLDSVWHLFANILFRHLAALEKAIALCVVDADVSTICGTIDTFVEEEL